jgi:tetratricopeptide (TPR) repeat protein
MFSHRCFLVALAACSAGTGPAQLPDEGAAIQALVFASQRAGFEHHDLDAYQAVFSDDAVLVTARGPEPGRYDVTIDAARNRAVKAIRFSGAPDRTRRWRFEEPRVQLTGDRAVLDVRVTTGSADDQEVVRERYALHRRDARWRIVENRWWLERVRFGDTEIVYDAARWRRLDAAVDEARAAGDRRALADALGAALRVTEAHAEWKQAVGENERDGSLWLRRAFAALAAGVAEDAIASFQRARELGEALPEFATAYLEYGSNLERDNDPWDG